MDMSNFKMTNNQGNNLQPNIQLVTTNVVTLHQILNQVILFYG